uniref:Endonuclease/exonuclease/phosphatase domain-containing protein n=2 Tax=Aegilops tauschii subsp. strangulata TaxID=200361 RepID=A0A453K837_AEGTS
ASQFSLTATVKSLTEDKEFYLMSVYGPTDDNLKEAFLDELRSVAPVFSRPWLTLGDFNLIYEARDKNNLNLNRRLMGKFRAALNRAELFEI